MPAMTRSTVGLAIAWASTGADWLVSHKEIFPIFATIIASIASIFVIWERIQARQLSKLLAIHERQKICEECLDGNIPDVCPLLRENCPYKLALRDRQQGHKTKNETMNWRNWKLGALVAVVMSLLSTGTSLNADTTWQQGIATFCIQCLSIFGAWQVQHPVDKITFESQMKVYEKTNPLEHSDRG